MNVAEIIKSSRQTAFSFEVLPPLKGNSISKVFDTIDALREFDPNTSTSPHTGVSLSTRLPTTASTKGYRKRAVPAP